MFKLFIPAFAALSLAGAAHAKDPYLSTASVTVPYADLDLSSSAGTAILQTRIAGAVKTVCGRPDSRDLHSWSAWQKCRAEAMEGAVQQLASARVNLPVVALAR